MQITCANTWCNMQFEIADDDLRFYDQVSPVFCGRKFPIPPPKCCPDCRQQRRIAQANERFLYPSTCGLCGKRTISQFSPAKKVFSYCRECWHGDKWDPRDHGQDFDFGRPFFEQFYEVKSKTPLQALSQQGTLVNSEYIHHAGSCKDCYLIMHADLCEGCMYGYGFKHNKFCIDGFYNLSSELCYDSIDVHHCYGLKGCQDCQNCHSSAFLRDCIGCRDCFLCTGLRNSEYFFENRKLTREEYREKTQSINLGSHAQYRLYKAKRKEIEKRHAFKEFQGHNVQNCTGNHLNNCKDVHRSFDCEDVESGKYLYQVVTGAKNCYDINQYGLNLQECYECCIVGESSYHLLFGLENYLSSTDVIYCSYMETCRNCFGCANMHHQKHCILNRQYTEDEYNDLCPKIIDHMRKSGEWGEFFPMNISFFGYNKTTAMLYYPLTKEESARRGLPWDDYESPPPDSTKVIPADKLPDNIGDIPDDILNWSVRCEVTGRPFKIQKQELRFYREQKLPIPRRSPDQRHLDRLALRTPRAFTERKCAKCGKKIQTVYTPEHAEIVYCESCYLAEVY